MFRRLSLLALCLGAALPTLSITEAAAREREYAPATEQPAPKTDDKLSGTLNVNTATAAQWELLPGIGPSTAQKLLDYRSKQSFDSIEQVMRVKGIGRKTFSRIKPYLTTKGETTLQKRK